MMITIRQQSRLIGGGVGGGDAAADDDACGYPILLFCDRLAAGVYAYIRLLPTTRGGPFLISLQSESPQEVKNLHHPMMPPCRF